MIFLRKQSILVLIIIIVIGAFLRFYKLDWANGLFTHPDEYHIVISVNQLSFPNQMHPHLFFYGSATVYLIYFTQEIIKHLLPVLSPQFLVPSPFLIGRFYSALFSTLTILIVYKISTTLFRKKLFAFVAAFFVAITPGLIQQAHFATTESALIFFLFLCLLLIIKFLNDNKLFYLILASISLGFALGVKISSGVFLFPLMIAIGIQFFRESLRLKEKILRLIEQIFVSLITIFTTFALVTPYAFLDFPAFRSSLDYEGSLAIGKIPVFYTRQFIDTIPILFQIEKIFPYALGPALLILGIVGFFVMLLRLGRIHLRGGRRADSSEVNTLFLVAIAFIAPFLPNAFLFAKWTRFIAPTFPFFAIFSAFFLQGLEKNRIALCAISAILLVGTTLWTMAFFSIYTNPDVRISASQWLESNTKPGSTFLVEGGNMIDLPLKGNFQRISLDFYNLEENPLVRQQIADALYTSDYFLVQSRRVFMNHQRLPHLYPRTAQFYDALFSRTLGFEQIKEFHSYPKLAVRSLQLEVNDESAEETWSVFDHPVIRVFKKNASFTREDYARFFEI